MAECKGCGAEILWAKTSAGRNIPLSVESEERRFTVRTEGGAREADTVRVAKNQKTYLSHFADCPNAEEFRRG